MPVTNEPYDQLKIDKLRHYLEAQAEKGQPKPYEIFVDHLKVVGKTEDPKEFDGYEFYLNDDSEKVRLLIYNSNQSPRNDQYSFLLQKTAGSKGPQSLGEVETIVQEKLAARDKEYETQKLREELEATKQELAETEEYAEKLEKEIAFLNQNKFKLGHINVAELAGVAIEGLMRRNPQVLSRIPIMGEALAGIIAEDNLEKEKMLAQPPKVEAKASIQKQTEPPLSEEDKRNLAWLKAVEEKLHPEQVGQFNLVLQAMLQEPGLITTIVQFINTKK